MSEEITIKKQDLWKYSTFVLIAVVLIGSVVFFTGSGSGTGSVINNGDNGGNVDLSVFESNSDLFPSLGPDNAKDVVIEFSDFQCPYCTLASGLPSWTSQYQSQYGDLIGVAGKLKELAKKGELRFIYVPMSFLGQESVYAAEAGYCTNEQGLFWEMHDAIFKASDGPSENDGKYSVENLKIIAKSVNGLNTGKFNDCLDDHKYANTVQQAGAYASTAASGTPTFFVNGQQVSASWQAISAAINA